MPAVDTRYGVKGLILNGNSGLVFWKSGGGEDLPGGRVESGETAKQAFLRELDEETGSLRVKFLGPIVPWSLLKNSGLIINGLTYLCLYFGGEIKCSLEHSGFMWVPLNQLRDIDVYWKFGLDKFGFDSIERKPWTTNKRCPQFRHIA